MTDRNLKDVMLDINAIDIDSIEKGDVQAVLFALLVMQHNYQSSNLFCEINYSDAEETDIFCDKIPCACSMIRLIAASVEILLDYNNREGAYEFIQDAFVQTFEKPKVLH